VTFKQIPLTQGKVALVDEADFDLVCQFKWRARFSYGRWYASRTVKHPDGKRRDVQMHRFILGNATEHTDHINHDGLDNRRVNLRPCSRTQNAHNRMTQKHTSSFKGVCFFKETGKWHASICINKKKVHLGYFLTEREAAAAYDGAAVAAFGQFARTNQQEGLL
jgi:hypothetical protein